MEIKILGIGCPRCSEVEKRVMDALAETGIVADVQKIKDIKLFISMGVFSTPGLIINGKVKSQGKIPGKDEIKQWVKEASAA